MTNYKSDFSVLISFCDCRELFALKPYEYDFEVDFYTTDRKKTYRAFRQGDNFINCRIEGEKLRVIFNDHHLPPGELCAEMTYHIPDNLFSDGEQKVVVTQRCGVTLTREGGCPSVEQVELILPTIKGDKGEKGEAAEVLPKIEALIDPNNGYLSISNAEYYLERGYVPLLFRKISARVRARLNPESDRRTTFKRKGWSICGGQGVIKIQDTKNVAGELIKNKVLVTMAYRSYWSYQAEHKDYYSGNNARYMLSPFKRLGEDEYGNIITEMYIGWGRRSIHVWSQDNTTKRFTIHTPSLRFRFAIGFVKPYEQPFEKRGKAITPKDCVSSLAEFSVTYTANCFGTGSTAYDSLADYAFTY